MDIGLPSGTPEEAPDETSALYSNVTFIDVAPIRIGDHTMIAPGCVLTTVDHLTRPPRIKTSRLHVHVREYKS